MTLKTGPGPGDGRSESGCGSQRGRRRGPGAADATRTPRFPARRRGRDQFTPGSGPVESPPAPRGARPPPHARAPGPAGGKDILGAEPLDRLLALPEPLPRPRVANPVLVLLVAVAVLEARVNGLWERLLWVVKRLEQIQIPKIHLCRHFGLWERFEKRSWTPGPGSKVVGRHLSRGR